MEIAVSRELPAHLVHLDFPEPEYRKPGTLPPLGGENDRVSINRKTALVVNAYSQIGHAIALRHALQGCNVVASGHTIKSLERLGRAVAKVEGTPETGEWPRGRVALGQLKMLALDPHSNGPGIDDSIATAWDAFGGLDIVVNVMDPLAYAEGLTGKDETKRPEHLHANPGWREAEAAARRGAEQLGRAAAARMQAGGKPSAIVHVAPTGYWQGDTWQGPFEAHEVACSAIVDLTERLAEDLGPLGVRVNAVAAAPVGRRTGAGDRSEGGGGDPRDHSGMKAALEEVAPLEELGALDPNLSACLLLLGSDAGRDITGQAFRADDGYCVPKRLLQAQGQGQE